MTCFFDSLCFLEICIGCFRIWCSRYLLKLSLSCRYFSWSRLLLGFSSTLYEYTCPAHVAPTEGWNLSSRGMDFYQVSFIHRCLPKSILPRFPQTMTQRSWGHSTAQPVQWLLLVQIPNQGLSAYYPMHRWAELLPGLFAYGVGSHNYSRGTFVHR